MTVSRKLIPCARWTDDCQGKKDYDGPFLSINTRYWPSGGGFHILQTGPPLTFEESKDPRIRPSANAAIHLEQGTPNEDGDADYIIVSEQRFEADTEIEVKALVEEWVAGEINRIASLVLHTDVAPSAPPCNDTEARTEMLRWVTSSIIEYPNGGGDIGVMKALERQLVAAQAEAYRRCADNCTDYEQPSTTMKRRFQRWALEAESTEGKRK